MKLVLAVLVFVPVMMACGACHEAPATPPVSADGGAGGAPPVADPCERACQRLVELGCPEAEPTEDGASCVEVCRTVEGSGAVSLEPECVAELLRCEDVDGCVSSATP